MIDQFVILTHQRSGSNMLVSMLDSHPEIKCFGELMRITPEWMKQKGYRGALRVLEKVPEHYKEARYRFDYPEAFVQEAFATAPNRSFYGFKLHINQHTEYMKRLIHDPKWKIVILQRENKLAQFSSSKIAEITGQGNAPKGTKIKQATAQFDSREFKSFLARMQKEWNRVWEEIDSAGRDYFYIPYTNLASQSALQNLFQFLGADPAFDVEAGTEKRNPSNILARFSNQEEAASALEEMGRTEWSEEKLKSDAEVAS